MQRKGHASLLSPFALARAAFHFTSKGGLFRSLSSTGFQTTDDVHLRIRQCYLICRWVCCIGSIIGAFDLIYIFMCCLNKGESLKTQSTIDFS